jgi:tetratricopeptide (TPR) repeat protein
LEILSAGREIFNYIEMNENPNHPYLLTGLGEYYMRLPISENNEDINQAEKYFKKAISIQPNNYYPYWCLSKLYIQKNDYKKAKDCLDRAHQKVVTSDNAINRIRIENDIDSLVQFSAGQL